MRLSPVTLIRKWMGDTKQEKIHGKEGRKGRRGKEGGKKEIGCACIHKFPHFKSNINILVR